MLPYKLTFAILAILLAYLYSKYKNLDEGLSQERQALILKAWQANIKTPPRRFNRVTVGTNACVDLIVSGVDLLNALRQEPSQGSDLASLNSLEDLQQVFSHFFAKGAAAERYFANGEVFERVVEIAANLSHTEWHVGGNAALMAQNMAEAFPDLKVQLVGPVGPRTQELLHENIRIPESSLQDSDAVHLILEYSVGQTWGASTCPVATRFITSHDQANSIVEPLEEFFSVLELETPELIVLSGLHMMDGQDGNLIHQRMQIFLDELEGVPPHIPVHLELASMTNEYLVKSIVEQVFSKVASIGLNEQELAFVSNVVSGPHSDLYTSTGPPPVHQVVDIMAWLLENFAYSAETRPHTRLTRLHFHTLSYHIVGVVPSTWLNLQSAVAAGTRHAGKLACSSAELDPSKMVLKMPLSFKLYSGDVEHSFDAANPVTSFSHKGFEFAISPVLVCREPIKTVGLGDSISATGLMYSSFIIKI